MDPCNAITVQLEKFYYEDKSVEDSHEDLRIIEQSQTVVSKSNPYYEPPQRILLAALISRSDITHERRLMHEITIDLVCQPMCSSAVSILYTLYSASLSSEVCCSYLFDPVIPTLLSLCLTDFKSVFACICYRELSIVHPCGRYSVALIYY